MDLYLLSVLMFVVLLILIVYRDRKNVKREGILLLRRTQRGKRFLIRTAKRFPRFWNGMGIVGVFVGFGASIYIFYFLIERLVTFIMVPAQVPPLGVVLPTPAATGTFVPGLLLIPFWYWIISIGVLVLVHEGLHGIMAAREKAKIKSMGWGLFFVIPLAFVEPDEKQLEEKGFWPQLRVFAAGSWANFITAGAALGITILFISSITMPFGAGIAGVSEGDPAQQVNLTGIITHIDGQRIMNSDGVSDTLKGFYPGRTVTIRTAVLKPSDLNSRNYMVSLATGDYEERSYHVTLTSRPDGKEGGWLGIGSADINMLMEWAVPYFPVLDFIWGLLAFLLLINLGVGLFNLLPMKPLDGGRMWEVLLKRAMPKKGGLIAKRLGWLTLFLLIAIFSSIAVNYI